MNTQIVFTGLCSFLNVDGKNQTMGDPSVILVQTPHEDDPEEEHEEAAEEEREEGEEEHKEHGEGKRDSAQKRFERDATAGEDPQEERSERHEPHIAFLAFHSGLVQVDDDSGFKPVPRAEEFMYMEINGFELSMPADPPAIPSVDDTYYDYVVRKDDYWTDPDVKDDWDPNYVAPKGQRPNQRGVKTFMRFGSGHISAALISHIKWKFPNGLEKNFAEEVVYSGFPHAADAVVITLNALPLGPESGGAKPVSSSFEHHGKGEEKAGSRTLRFTQRNPDPSKPLTLIIGNGTEKDMPPTVRRQLTDTPPIKDKDHFKFLNRVAAKKHGDGPIPKSVPPINHGPGTTGGRPSGICGPGTGNGGTKAG